MSSKHTQVPAAAYRFRRAENDAHVFYAEQSVGVDNSKRKRKFSGVGYSGEVIPNHFWWGDVAFDLSSMEVPAKLPILLNHDFDKRIGYSTQSTVSDQRGLELQGDMLTNSFAQEVLQDSEDGFPWQMSVHIEPGSIEQVAPGVEVTLNGRKFTGPLTVFRNSLIRECSFCATGYDSNTSAETFTRQAAFSNPLESNPMTKDEQDRMAALEAENATLQSKLAAQETAAKEFAQKTQREKREVEARALFKDLKLEFSAEAAAPYMTLEESAFNTIAAQLRSTFAKQAATPADKGAPAALFQHTATSGDNAESKLGATSAEALRKVAEKKAQSFAARHGAAPRSPHAESAQHRKVY